MSQHLTVVQREQVVRVNEATQQVTVTGPGQAVKVVPSGPPGPPGPAGAAGGAAISHHQTAAASVWTIAGVSSPRQPVILLDNEPNRQVHTDVQHYPSTQTVVLTFPSPVTGWAYL